MQNNYKLKPGSIDALPSLVGSDTTSVVPGFSFMKEIQLTQGKVTLVDDSDFEWLNQWKWYAEKRKNTFYAKRGKDDKKMHFVLLGSAGDGKVWDHKDRNGLNNQRDNLRVATVSQNCANKGKRESCKSKYIGVSWHKKAKKWIAQISKNKRDVYLGVYIKEEDAAIAYNQAAMKTHGQFASLNIINL